jgi:hypothetical protein
MHHAGCEDCLRPGGGDGDGDGGGDGEVGLADTTLLILELSRTLSWF